MQGRTDSRRRLLVVLVTFVVVGASLVSRLVWWQVVQHDELAAKAQRQTTVEFQVPVRRGTIYDRTGTVVLATTVERYIVAASPDQMSAAERRSVGTELSAILGLDPDGASSLADKIESEKAYVILARGLDDGTADQIRAAVTDGRLRAITIEPEAVRVYPQAGGAAGTTLAAHLLGFVNRDGEGQYGVEERYQSELAGTPRQLLAERDVVGRPITDTAQILSPGVAGSDIRLTIDTNLQLAAEQEVLAAYTADRAVSVSAVVMDPKTGAIVAMASYPSYDANQYRTIAAEDPSVFIDPIVSYVYEPGSVFKMLTALAALEQGTIDLSTPILDSGSLSLDHGENRIYDADRSANGLYAGARHRGLLAQRRRGQDRPRPGQVDRQGGLDPGRDVGPPRLRGEDRGRPRRRGAGAGPRPGPQALEPGRPGQRLVRPGRGRDPAPARHRLRGDGQRREAGHAARRRWRR